MKIAVCDDDRPIREELIRLIQRQVSDADITEFQSGEELLCAGVDFDIYFLDIEMDSVSGMELARHIREREETGRRRSIIIFVTAGNKQAEKKTEDKYASVSAYEAYLKDKYPCLTASNYKVTISPAYLEKCIKDPEKAELLEMNLDILPGCHQNLIAAWNALGADVKNEEWVFYEDGTAGMSPNMYVVTKNSSSSNSVESKIAEKRSQRKILHRRSITKRENF